MAIKIYHQVKKVKAMETRASKMRDVRIQHLHTYTELD